MKQFRIILSAIILSACAFFASAQDNTAPAQNFITELVEKAKQLEFTDEEVYELLAAVDAKKLTKVQAEALFQDMSKKKNGFWARHGNTVLWVTAGVVTAAAIGFGIYWLCSAPKPFETKEAYDKHMQKEVKDWMDNVAAAGATEAAQIPALNFYLPNGRVMMLDCKGMEQLKAANGSPERMRALCRAKGVSLDNMPEWADEKFGVAAAGGAGAGGGAATQKGVRRLEADLSHCEIEFRNGGRVNISRDDFERLAPADRQDMVAYLQARGAAGHLPSWLNADADVAGGGGGGGAGSAPARSPASRS